LIGTIMADEIIAAMRNALLYDAGTGAITWISPTSHNVRAGAPAGTKTAQGYLHFKFRGRRYLAHRVAWALQHGCWPAGLIDHKDGNRSNNAAGNLRDVTPSINSQNQRTAHSSSRSGLMGVNWRQDKRRWQATIRELGKSTHIGYFCTADEAHTAYLLRKRAAHAGCTI
jgi:HNH endonuclease